MQDTGFICEGQITGMKPDITIRRLSNAETVIKKADFGKVFKVVDNKLYYIGTNMTVETGDWVSLYMPSLRTTVTPIVMRFRRDSATQDYSPMVRSDMPVMDTHLQLGASLFYVPPTSIKVEKITTTKRTPTIRSKNSIKTQSGHVDTQVTLSLVFPNKDAVNNEDDGLRALIAQFKRTPFVPVVNRYLNFVHGIDAVALYRINIGNMPNFPGVITAEVTLFAFDYQIFMPQEPSFIDTIDRDLYTWYYKRGLLEPKTKDGVVEMPEFTCNSSHIGISYIPEDVLKKLKNTRMQFQREGFQLFRDVMDMEALAQHDLDLYEKVLTKSNSDLKKAIKAAAKDKKVVHGTDFVIVPRDICYKIQPGEPEDRFYTRLETLDQDLWWKIFQPGQYLDTQHNPGRMQVGYVIMLKTKHPDNVAGKIYKADTAISEPFATINEEGYGVCVFANAGGALFKAGTRLGSHLKETLNNCKTKKDKIEQDKLSALGEGIEQLMEIWHLDEGNTILTDISIGYQNMLSRMVPTALEKPAYQFLGTQDAYIKLNFEVLGDIALRSLQDLFKYTQRVMREYRYDLVGGFVKIDNDLINMFGVKNVLIDSITCSTVPNFPGRYVVEITMMDYDIKQRDREYGEIIMNMRSGKQTPSDPVIKYTADQYRDTKFYPGYKIDYKSPDGAVYWTKVEDLMKYISVYPDLDLPTYTDVNNHLKNESKRKFKLDNPLGGVYVDPDFYFRPQILFKTLANDGLKDVIRDPITNKELPNGLVVTMKKEGKTSEDDVILGQKYIKTNEPPQVLVEDFDEKKRFEILKQCIYDLGDVTKKGPQEWRNEHKPLTWYLAGNFIKGIRQGDSPEVNQKIETLRGAASNCGYDVNLDTGGGYVWILPKMYDVTTKTKAADLPQRPQTVGVGPEGRSDVQSWRDQWYDQTTYECCGRMARAFPTAHVFLVDEGNRISWFKLWDNFYGLNAISSIEVIKSRKLAADTAIVTVSNTYRRFRDTDFGKKDYEKDKVKFALHRLFQMWIDEEMEKRHAEIYERIGIAPGARLHIRMGYGNNLSELPVVFNGVIAEMDTGEMMTMVAQGDGVELCKPLNYKKDEVCGPLQTGMAASDLLSWLLVRGDKQNLRWLWSVIKSFWEQDTDNGVVHFGIPNYFGGFIPSAGEMAQNIYPGNGTGLHKDSEPDLDLVVYDKTIYDVAQQCAAIIPNYIAAVHPFEFRSTLFYGKPWWDLTYGYDIKYIEYVPVTEETYLVINPQRWDYNCVYTKSELNDNPVRIDKAKDVVAYGESQHWAPKDGTISSADKAVGYRESKEWRNNQWVPCGYLIRPKKKPFQQWHVYSSFGHIINNDIKATSQGMVHNVIPVLKKDKLLLTMIKSSGVAVEPKEIECDTVKADSDIFSNIQKTITMDTGIYVKSLGVNGWLSFWNPIGWTGLVRDVANIYNVQVHTKMLAINMAASVIRDYMKDMYQGNMTIIGDPTVKPHDGMYISDAYNEMFGTCLVKQVVHQFSLDTGFITDVCPDAAAGVIDDEYTNRLMWTAAVAGGASLGWGLTSAAASNLRAKALLQVALGLDKVAGWARAGSEAIVANTGAVASGIETAAAKVGTQIAAKGVTNAVANGALNVTLTAEEAITAASDTALSGAAALEAGLPVAGWVVLAVQVAITLGIRVLQSMIDQATTASQCVIMSFLTYHGEEFSAGVNGHRGLAVGSFATKDKRGFWDRMVSCLPPFVKSVFNLNDVKLSGASIVGDAGTEEMDLNENQETPNAPDKTAKKKQQDLDKLITYNDLTPQDIPAHKTSGSQGWPAGADRWAKTDVRVGLNTWTTGSGRGWGGNNRSFTYANFEITNDVKNKIVFNPDTYTKKFSRIKKVEIADKLVLALTITEEAGAEGPEGMWAVGCSIVDRANMVGMGIQEACSEPSQYDGWQVFHDKAPNGGSYITVSREALLAAECALQGLKPSCFGGKSYKYFANLKKCENWGLLQHTYGADPILLNHHWFTTDTANVTWDQGTATWIVKAGGNTRKLQSQNQKNKNKGGK